MSQVYNPESDIIAEIERLEMEIRSTRRRIEHARNQDDRRVLNRQIQDMQEEIELLRRARVLNRPVAGGTRGAGPHDRSLARGNDLPLPPTSLPNSNPAASGHPRPLPRKFRPLVVPYAPDETPRPAHSASSISPAGGKSTRTPNPRRRSRDLLGFSLPMLHRHGRHRVRPPAPKPRSRIPAFGPVAGPACA